MERKYTLRAFIKCKCLQSALQRKKNLENPLSLELQVTQSSENTVKFIQITKYKF